MCGVLQDFVIFWKFEEFCEIISNTWFQMTGVKKIFLPLWAILGLIPSNGGPFSPFFGVTWGYSWPAIDHLGNCWNQHICLPCSCNPLCGVPANSSLWPALLCCARLAGRPSRLSLSPAPILRYPDITFSLGMTVWVWILCGKVLVPQSMMQRFHTLVSQVWQIPKIVNDHNCHIWPQSVTIKHKWGSAHQWMWSTGNGIYPGSAFLQNGNQTWKRGNNCSPLCPLLVSPLCPICPSSIPRFYWWRKKKSITGVGQAGMLQSTMHSPEEVVVQSTKVPDVPDMQVSFS